MVAGDDPLPEIRSVLAAEYAHLPAEELEALLESIGVDAEDFEDLLGAERRWRRGARRRLRRIRRNRAGQRSRRADVGQRVQRGLLGAARGALSGVMSGGGLGALVGAVRGGISGATQRPGQPAPPQAARAPAQIQPTPPAQPAQMPAAGPVQQPVAAQPAPAGPAGPSSGAALLSFLAQPAVQQALSSLIAGPLARRQVMVGATPVPTEAILNTLSALAQEAAAVHYADGLWAAEDVPRYLLDEQGEFLVDPAVPEQRAAVVLHLLDRAEEDERRARFYELLEEREYDDESADDYQWELDEQEPDYALDAVDAYFAEADLGDR